MRGYLAWSAALVHARPPHTGTSPLPVPPSVLVRSLQLAVAQLARHAHRRLNVHHGVAPVGRDKDHLARLLDELKRLRPSGTELVSSSSTHCSTGIPVVCSLGFDPQYDCVGGKRNHRFRPRTSTLNAAVWEWTCAPLRQGPREISVWAQEYVASKWMGG